MKNRHASSARHDPSMGLTGELARRGDHPGSQARTDSGEILRPDGWPRRPIDVTRWNWTQAIKRALAGSARPYIKWTTKNRLTKSPAPLARHLNADDAPHQVAQCCQCGAQSWMPRCQFHDFLGPRPNLPCLDLIRIPVHCICWIKLTEQLGRRIDR